MYLPLYLKADRLPCLMVGGGKVASRKCAQLLPAGCKLTVIAPEIGEAVRREVEGGRVRWLCRVYQPGDCEGFSLVVAATPHREVNQAVFLEAQSKGIPVNVVDVPELCTVIFGASWRDGPLEVSVTTGGKAPFMAAAVRDRISDVFCGVGAWVEAAERFRAAVRRKAPDPVQRDFLYRLFLDRMQRGGTVDPPPGSELEPWLAWIGERREENA